MAEFCRKINYIGIFSFSSVVSLPHDQLSVTMGKQPREPDVYHSVLMIWRKGHQDRCNGVEFQGPAKSISGIQTRNLPI